PNDGSGRPLSWSSTPPALPTDSTKRLPEVHSRRVPGLNVSSTTRPSSVCTRIHVASTAFTRSRWPSTAAASTGDGVAEGDDWTGAAGSSAGAGRVSPVCARRSGLGADPLLGPRESRAARPPPKSTTRTLLTTSGCPAQDLRGRDATGRGPSRIGLPVDCWYRARASSAGAPQRSQYSPREPPTKQTGGRGGRGAPSWAPRWPSPPPGSPPPPPPRPASL